MRLRRVARPTAGEEPSRRGQVTPQHGAALVAAQLANAIGRAIVAATQLYLTGDTGVPHPTDLTERGNDPRVLALGHGHHRRRAGHTAASATDTQQPHEAWAAPVAQCAGEHRVGPTQQWRRPEA